MKPNLDYDSFNKIDGSHPFRDSFPEGFIDYKARQKKGGNVGFFNFSLAKEMGLIEKDHPHRLNKTLEKKILDTFALQIINEYDIENNVPIRQRDIKEGSYMATRYLQLQHPDKRGTTSGDGRGIWNGRIRNGHKYWDISSCGTGATSLSPATAIHGKHFQTGDPSVSYGCGYAHAQDGLSAALFSEILHKNGHSTERTLAVIEFEDQISINIRAAANLLRPSHLFRLVKLDDYEHLRLAVDYWCRTEIENRRLDRAKSVKEQRKRLLKKTCQDFAKAAARYESDFLFVWMDWDGDNILIDGGIIDYGSVRQFGLCHRDYRYDDDGRWSTNLLEQRQKAKNTVKTVAQIVEFLNNKRKPNLKEMSRHPICQEFDKIFEKEKLRLLAKKMGFKDPDADWLTQRKTKKLKAFLKSFQYFEHALSRSRPYSTGDGLNRDPIFSMRTFFRIMPGVIQADGPLTDKEFMMAFRSEGAKRQDLKLFRSRSEKIRRLQELYLEITQMVAEHRKLSVKKMLLEMSFRCSVIHKPDRITGNSIVLIAEELLKMRDNMTFTDWTALIEDFVEDQKLRPGPRKKPQSDNQLLEPITEIADLYKESV